MFITIVIIFIWLKDTYLKYRAYINNDNQKTSIMNQEDESAMTQRRHTLSTTAGQKRRLRLTTFRSTSATLSPNSKPIQLHSSSHRFSYPSGLRTTNSLRIGPRLSRDKSIMRYFFYSLNDN